MAKKSKKGTVWLLNRLKAGEVLTQQSKEELMDYICQLEVSLDRCYAAIQTNLENSIELLLDPTPAREAIKHIQARLPQEHIQKQPDIFHRPIRCDSDAVYRDVRIHRDLDLNLAELAHYNKMATGEIIIRACEYAANYPGAVGLTSCPPQESEQKG